MVAYVVRNGKCGGGSKENGERITHCLLILSMLKPWVHSLINCVPLILLGSVGEVEPSLGH